ncbi:DUF5995 family protein [Calothrix sp. CCY 0018]|uniref:DUF5995 family protein n=1 Tax=Calothrix sp. CCY 0018 TaxID=3103864 RepID=UPI0039C74D5F
MKNLLLGSVALLLSIQSSALAVSQRLSSQTVCQEGKPECLELVIQEMERRYEPLEAQRDRDGIFALSYLRTTEKLQQLFDTVGFENPASIIREDALFADYYFEAYDNYHLGTGNVPTAWQIAFDAAENQSVSGTGNLVLGTSAHILRDLPFVLYELDQKGTPISLTDHNLFNEVLLQVDVLGELAQKFDPTIDDDDLPGTSDDLERFQVVALWRELTWRNYEKLRDAPNDASLAQVAAEIEGLSAATATSLFEQFKNPTPPISVPEPSSTLFLLFIGTYGAVLHIKKTRRNQL